MTALKLCPSARFSFSEILSISSTHFQVFQTFSGVLYIHKISKQRPPNIPRIMVTLPLRCESIIFCWRHFCYATFSTGHALVERIASLPFCCFGAFFYSQTVSKRILIGGDELRTEFNKFWKTYPTFAESLQNQRMRKNK